MSACLALAPLVPPPQTPWGCRTAPSARPTHSPPSPLHCSRIIAHLCLCGDQWVHIFRGRCEGRCPPGTPTPQHFPQPSAFSFRKPRPRPCAASPHRTSIPPRPRHRPCPSDPLTTPRQLSPSICPGMAILPSQGEAWGPEAQERCDFTPPFRFSVRRCPLPLPPLLLISEVFRRCVPSESRQHGLHTARLRACCVPQDAAPLSLASFPRT